MRPNAVTELRDYFESIHFRSATAARATRSELSVFRDAVCISWPIGHPLSASAITVEAAPLPKQAPDITFDLVLPTEWIADGEMVAPGKRLVASSIIFMTLTSLRFSDVQMLTKLGINESRRMVRSPFQDTQIAWLRLAVCGATYLLLEFYRLGRSYHGVPQGVWKGQWCAPFVSYPETPIRLGYRAGFRRILLPIAKETYSSACWRGR